MTREDLPNAPQVKGKKFLIKAHNGETLTRNEAIMAQCYDCMGYYDGGVGDCKCPECPLYQFMPYKGKETK